MDLLHLINGNQGLITLGLLLVVVEMRVNLRLSLKDVFRRLSKLEEN